MPLSPSFLKPVGVAPKEGVAVGVDFTAKLYVGFIVYEEDFWTHATGEPHCPEEGHPTPRGGAIFCDQCGRKLMRTVGASIPTPGFQYYLSLDGFSAEEVWRGWATVSDSDLHFVDVRYRNQEPDKRYLCLLVGSTTAFYYENSGNVVHPRDMVAEGFMVSGLAERVRNLLACLGKPVNDLRWVLSADVLLLVPVVKSRVKTLSIPPETVS